jgi:hypothetical protein
MAQTPATHEYRVLATSRTSTMEREMNAAADGGFVFSGLIGGKEILVIMVKATGPDAAVRRSYKFIATSRTGTLEKELQQAGDAGFGFSSITVYKSEIAAVLERRTDEPVTRRQYKFLATSRTGTMQKELQSAGAEGYLFRGLTFGKEVLSVLERPAR